MGWTDFYIQDRNYAINSLKYEIDKINSLNPYDQYQIDQMLDVIVDTGDTDRSYIAAVLVSLLDETISIEPYSKKMHYREIREAASLAESLYNVVNLQL